MSTPNSTWRSAIAMLGAVTGATPETVAMQFNLSFGEGLELYSGTFSFRLGVNTLTTARVQSHAILSLHVETGTLEDPLGPNDSFELNSEVIASATLIMDTNDNALGEQTNYLWASGPKFNYVEELGSPLLIAQNPTFRVDALSSNTALSAGSVKFWYRYVILTQNELFRLVALGR